MRTLILAVMAGVMVAAPALAQTTQTPAGRQATRSAYDVQRLHPEVRRAVLAARTIEARAATAAERARAAAVLAEEAAARARAGQSGYLARFHNDFQFETQVRNGRREGYGVSVDQSPDYYGDRFAGTWVNDQFSGVGVLVFGTNANNRSGVQRFEGEYARDARNGAGVLYFRDGSRYAGIYTQNRRDIGGVFYHADGRRYEGEYNGGPTDRPNGYGVLWGPDGRIEQQGVWQDGALVTPLSQ